MNAVRWQQIKEIFVTAAKLAPRECAAFLDENCQRDEELRREVESLLENADEARSFLEYPAVENVADVLIDETRKLKSGQNFSHYRIIRQIGAGGMGEVYLAGDTKLDRKVAIKILNERFAKHDSNLNRFIREAKSASALNHPNILIIHEIGEDNRVNFIVSEYIEGKTLREIIKEKSLKLKEILDISIQVANALSAAHSAKIIHRDIKPENVIVRPDGYVKILDFGLAKLIEQKIAGLEDETVHQNQTASGIILGTVNYMSPEQAKGERVDERTDIFSFGTMIYEMIAGVTPFAANSMSETFANLMNDEPQPLARYSVNIPDEMERIISKTLRKNKDERYQTTKDLLIDLMNLQKRLEFQCELENTSSLNKRQEANTLLLKNEDKEINRKISGQTNSIAVLPFANMSNDSENDYFCDGLAEELLNALSKIKDLKVAARTSAFSFKGKNINVGEIGSLLNVNTILEGSVRKSANRLRITVQLVEVSNGYHLWSEKYDREMKDIFDVQDEIALAVVDSLKLKLFGEEKAAVLKRYTDDPKAYEFYLKGVYYRWKLTPEEFRKCGAYFHRAVNADPTFALGYFGLASYYGYGTAWGLLTMPPEEGWTKAEAAMKTCLELDATLPEGLIASAFKLVHYREWDKAGADIKRAAELNPTFPEIHHLYSFYLLAAGQFDDALSEAKYAIKLDPLSLNYSRFLGVCFFFARRYEEAIEQLYLTLELEPNNSSVHEILSGVYAQKGMFAEAAAVWQRVATLEGDDELAVALNRIEDNFTEKIKAVASRRIERMNEKAANGEFVLAISFARAYIMLGDEKQTFHWLKKAVEERNVFPLLMNSDPFYDRVRDDSRFQDLMRHIGFVGEYPRIS